MGNKEKSIFMVLKSILFTGSITLEQITYLCNVNINGAKSICSRLISKKYINSDYFGNAKSTGSYYTITEKGIYETQLFVKANEKQFLNKKLGSGVAPTKHNSRVLDLYNILTKYLGFNNFTWVNKFCTLKADKTILHPDAFFTINNKTYFYELDLGTEKRNKLLSKKVAYGDYISKMTNKDTIIFACDASYSDGLTCTDVKLENRVAMVRNLFLENIEGAQNMLYKQFLLGLDMYIDNYKKIYEFARMNIVKNHMSLDLFYEGIYDNFLLFYKGSQYQVTRYEDQVSKIIDFRFYTSRSIAIWDNGKLIEFYDFEDISYGNVGGVARAINIVQNIPANLNIKFYLCLMVDDQEQANMCYKEFSVKDEINMLFVEANFFESAQYWTAEELANIIHLSFMKVDGNEIILREFKEKLIME